ncbi:hypothetical protein JKP88DRAFT_286921 [Tribonema minus]|uniref:Uncharacterized protein n=1 Tax=Tribonema minus TaxID=303371 RepID=A0A835Z8M9_9STRA|nr:hypothetical protein JKP88DRAFT_286921 [Tribonema minus]
MKLLTLVHGGSGMSPWPAYAEAFMKEQCRCQPECTCPQGVKSKQETPAAGCACASECKCTSTSSKCRCEPACTCPKTAATQPGCPCATECKCTPSATPAAAVGSS